MELLDPSGNYRKGPFYVYEFDNPVYGIGSPYIIDQPGGFNTGYLKGGFTKNGAREFEIFNMSLKELKNPIKTEVR